MKFKIKKDVFEEVVYKSLDYIDLKKITEDNYFDVPFWQSLSLEKFNDYISERLKSEKRIEKSLNEKFGNKVSALSKAGYKIGFYKSADQSKDMQFAAVINDPRSIMFIADPCEEVAQFVVDLDPLLIRFLKNPSDEVIKSAVRSNGLSIQYVKKKPEMLQRIAVLNNPMALNHINNPSREVRALALRKNPNALHCIKYPTSTDFYEAVSQEPLMLMSFDNPSTREQVVAIENIEIDLLHKIEPFLNLANKTIKQAYDKKIKRK